VTFQPCCNPEEFSQDRLAVQSWSLPDGNWTFAAVFDGAFEEGYNYVDFDAEVGITGHAGHDTVDHAVKELPSLVKSALTELISSNSLAKPTLLVKEISDILSQTIAAFDDAIMKDLLDLFPGGETQIAGMSDEEINDLINDQASGGKNAQTLARCMRGTTALITLVDPTRENMWVANLGDCVASKSMNPNEK